MRLVVGAGFAAVAVAAVAWFALRGDDARTPVGAAQPAAKTQSSGATSHSSAPREREHSPSVVASRKFSQETLVWAGADAETVRAFQAKLSKLGSLIASLEDESDPAARQAMETLRSEVIAALRSDVSLTVYLLEATDGADEAVALSLGNVLRFSKDEELATLMSARLRSEASSPLERRVALRVLEGKSSDALLGPVVRAYANDSSDRVRDDASGVLARALSDSQYKDVAGLVRDEVYALLQDSAASNRARGLRTMLGIRSPSADDVRRVRALLGDVDPDVKLEATRAARVLESRR